MKVHSCQMLLGIFKELLFKGSQVLSVCPSENSSSTVKMSMHQGWIATDQRAQRNTRIETCLNDILSTINLT